MQVDWCKIVETASPVCPGLDDSKNAHLFSMVLHNLKDALRLLAQDPMTNQH